MFVEGYRADLAENPGDQGHRVLGLLPGRDLHAEPGHRRGLGCRDLQGGDDQVRLAAGGQDQAGQPLQGERVIPGQVPQVGAWSDQQGIEP